MTFTYQFEETKDKLEYLQERFNTEEKKHAGIHTGKYGSEMDFIGGLYLENGWWMDFYRCYRCGREFKTFGIFDDYVHENRDGEEEDDKTRP